MNISQMHVFFRQFAQQMGMQNVRAILPEQIDLLINTSISDTINQLIRENVGIKNDRIITDSSKIGTVNALRTLYKVSILPLATSNPALGFRVKNSRTGKMSTEDATKPTPFPNTLFYVDFSINYKTTTTGYNGTDDTAPLFSQDALETNLFPVRIIDDIFLADALNDFLLKTDFVLLLLLLIVMVSLICILTSLLKKMVLITLLKTILYHINFVFLI